MTSSVLHLRANNPLVPNRNEPQRMETYADELITSIIKDASKSAGESHDTSIQKPNELSPLQKSSENVSGEDNIEQKMTDVIHEIRSSAVRPTARMDSTIDERNAGLPRSLSESGIVNRSPRTEQLLPIRRDESSSESEDLYGIQSAPMNVSGHNVDYLSEQENRTIYPSENDHEFPPVKTGTVDDNHPSLYAIKQDNLDETQRFRPTSPTGRPPVISNQSTHTFLEETESSTATKMDSSNPLDDTDHPDQEDGTEAHDSSHDISLLTRPRSPTPNDSRKVSAYAHVNNTNRPRLIVNNERNDSSVESGDHEHDARPSSRPGSNHVSRFLTSNQEPDRSAIGEQLRIPTNDLDNERVNSPPPPPPSAASGIASIVLFNPLLRNNDTDKEQDLTRSPSEMSRASSPTSMASNAKLVEEAIDSSRSRSESNVSSPPTGIVDQKPISRHGSEVTEPTLQDSSPRRESVSQQQQQQEFDHQREQRAASRTSQESTSHQENSNPEQPGDSDDEKTIVHRKSSPSAEQHSSDHQKNRCLEDQSSSRSVDDDEHPATVLVNNDRRRSSSNNSDQGVKHQSIPSSNESRTSAKHRSSLPRRLGQQSKRTTSLSTDKIVVTPIAADSSKHRSHNRKTSSTDSDDDRRSASKLPSLTSSAQREKSNRSQAFKKQSMPSLSNRSPVTDMASARRSTFSEDEQPAQWIKSIGIPRLQFSDDEPVTLDNKHSDDAGLAASPTQKAHTQSREKGEQRRSSRRSLSANSSTHIRLTDGKSLDSTSENNTELSQHDEHAEKSTEHDLVPHTALVNDPRGSRPDGSSDEPDFTAHKPLKATKPMSEHLRSTRVRASSQQPRFTSRGQSTPNVRYTGKQSKDPKQEKDPINVNVTVVVKNASDDDDARSTPAEAFVEQERPVTSGQKRRSDRSKSAGPSTPSDTEPILTEKHPRPKHISRTCQTYECVFRRMERERDQELRARSATEKNVQLRKSQVRSRNKSPKKFLSPYLSTDSVRIEELLRKQYYQSRRSQSKASFLARSLSPHGGKLLILRPTLPFHHTDAVGVQRIRLQYEIDLIPQNTAPTHRNRSAGAQSRIPAITASAASVRSASQTTGARKYQRKDNSLIKES